MAEARKLNNGGPLVPVERRAFPDGCEHSITHLQPDGKTRRCSYCMIPVPDPPAVK